MLMLVTPNISNSWQQQKLEVSTPLGCNVVNCLRKDVSYTSLQTRGPSSSFLRVSDLGGGFVNHDFVVFSPWGNDPTWLAHMFQLGGWNHQLYIYIQKVTISPFPKKKPSWGEELLELQLAELPKNHWAIRWTEKDAEKPTRKRSFKKECKAAQDLAHLRWSPYSLNAH